MSKCRVEVVAAMPSGVSIWCDTCKENVAWAETFTAEEVTATAAGHRQVMARANGLRREHERGAASIR